MISKLLAHKWKFFHQSLANMLTMSISIVDERLRIIDVFYPQPMPGRVASDHIWTGHQDFIKLFPPGEGVRIACSPSGSLHALIPIANCCTIVLSAGEAKNSVAAEDSWAGIEEVANGISALYSKLIVSINECSDMGQGVILFTALDEINNLMVGLLSPETFNLQRVADLVVSALIIILDARGAWVFTRCLKRFKTAYRGEKIELVQKAAEAWLGAGVSGDLEPAISSILKSEEGFYPFWLKMPNSILCLGVYTPEQRDIDTVLSAFAKQVAIAVEMDSLYNALQRKIGKFLDSVRLGIIVTNREGQVMIVNHSATNILRDTKKTAVLGGPFAKIALGGELEESLTGAIEGMPFCRRQSMIASGEKMIHLDWEVSPLLMNNKTIVGAIILFEDITERVTLTRQHEDWERLAAAGEVAAGLAHEIRNPLAAAQGALQLFELANTNTQRRKLLAMFSEELKRMNGILDEYLHLTRPSEGKLLPVDLSAVIASILFLIKSEAILNNVELIFNPARAVLPLVLSNHNSLKQVFLNIAKNAIEAMKQGGYLTISVGSKEGKVWIEFRDNGPGIPLEHQDNVFRSFFTTKAGGTGLGLAISQRIIEGMDGEIEIRSAPGTGTVVTVSLPALEN